MCLTWSSRKTWAGFPAIQHAHHVRNCWTRFILIVGSMNEDGLEAIMVHAAGIPAGISHCGWHGSIFSCPVTSCLTLSVLSSADGHVNTTESQLFGWFLLINLFFCWLIRGLRWCGGPHGADLSVALFFTKGDDSDSDVCFWFIVLTFVECQPVHLLSEYTYLLPNSRCQSDWVCLSGLTSAGLPTTGKG